MSKIKKVVDFVQRNFRGAVSQPEYNSGVPMVGMPGTVQPPSIQEMIRQYIRTEVSDQADQDGEETFEEADDFEVDGDDEDMLPMTHHEVLAMDEMELRGHAHNYGVDIMEDSQGSGPPSSGSSGGDTAIRPVQPATPTPPSSPLQTPS
ncbi:MAG: hypothetical protein [Microviridae sp.]|nr:MAG: hypothetical protein [Microviridae sp.]